MVLRIALDLEMVSSSRLGRILSLTVRRGDLPPAIHNRFPKVGENGTGSKVSHVHNMVFGANGSYMIAWKGKDGRNYQGILLAIDPMIGDSNQS
jgi:hypothetical protein